MEGSRIFLEAPSKPPLQEGETSHLFMRLGCRGRQCEGQREVERAWGDNGFHVFCDLRRKISHYESQITSCPVL